MPTISVGVNKKYYSDDDAYTLARAEEIKADQKRYSEAIQAAKVMADRETEQANAMRKIANKKPLKEKSNPIQSNTNNKSNNSFNVFKRI